MLRSLSQLEGLVGYSGFHIRVSDLAVLTAYCLFLPDYVYPAKALLVKFHWLKF